MIQIQDVRFEKYSKIMKNLFDQSNKNEDLIYFDLKIRLKLENIEIRKTLNG